MATNVNEPRSNQIFFDPDEHSEGTGKAFDEFTKQFELRYNAQYPDPPKVSLDAALQRWKITNTTVDVPDPKPDLAQYDAIVLYWRERDRVAKFLGMFSSQRMYADWTVAQPDTAIREVATWNVFKQTMHEYYLPTENATLKHFHFRHMTQNDGETFPAWCIRVEKEAKRCQFKCHHNDCNSEDTNIRDQIVIGATSDIM